LDRWARAFNYAKEFGSVGVGFALDEVGVVARAGGVGLEGEDGEREGLSGGQADGVVT
jgi:hypothetical protein